MTKLDPTRGVIKCNVCKTDLVTWALDYSRPPFENVLEHFIAKHCEVKHK